MRRKVVDLARRRAAQAAGEVMALDVERRQSHGRPPGSSGLRAAHRRNPARSLEPALASAQLPRALRGGLDRVEHGRAEARRLESRETCDRRAAGRRHAVLELRGVRTALARELRGSEHGLDREAAGPRRAAARRARRRRRAPRGTRTRRPGRCPRGPSPRRAATSSGASHAMPALAKSDCASARSAAVAAAFAA